MRQLFTPPAEPTAVTSHSTPPISVAAAPVVTKTVPVAVIARERAAAKRQSFVPLRRLWRRKAAACVTLAASLLFGARWFVANAEPTYPTAGGVYPAATTPALNTPNAATLYQAAEEAFPMAAVRDAHFSKGTKSLVDAPVSEQAPLVAQARESLDLLRRGMRYGYRAPAQTDGMDYAPKREMARMLVAEARVRAAAGNTAGALESSLDAVRMGADIGQGPRLIDGMVGVLMQMIGTQEGVNHVAGLTAPQARAGAQRLETLIASTSTMAQIWTAERGYDYRILQRMYAAGTLEPGANDELRDLFSSKWLKGAGGRLAYDAGMLCFTKQGMINDLADAQNGIIERLQMSYQQEKRLAEEGPTPHNPLVFILTVPYRRSFGQTTMVAAGSRVLLARLAVQAYRAEHNGAAPPSLAALTVGANPYLRAVPSDPFSMDGRAALRYNPSTGAAYSVGENGTDDGGAGDDALYFAK